MKANEAPEKIYVALDEIDEGGRTFVLDHRIDYPICTEYTRTDAFIEKAEDWITRNGSYYVGFEQGQPCIDKEFIDNFKTAMMK